MPDITNYTDELDYNALKNTIKQVLLKYFEYDDDGKPNPAYDPSFSAAEAIDEIHDLIGKI